jgi:hypothetical protein
MNPFILSNSFPEVLMEIRPMFYYFFYFSMGLLEGYTDTGRRIISYTAHRE